MSIYDGRPINRNKQVQNRLRFLKKYKEAIQDRINETTKRNSIKDLGEKSKGLTIKTKKDPRFGYIKDLPIDRVLPGNPTWRKGQVLNKPPGSGEDEGDVQGGDGEGEDNFNFILTKEEFLDLYFGDLALPNLVKESMTTERKLKYVNGGYCKEGTPSRLSIRKTFEAAIARRIANKKEDHKPAFLDEHDLRYIRKSQVEERVTKAVVFFVMDVSGSMTEERKQLAKQFYLLTYLFLKRIYKDVELVFIAFHESAFEVDEYSFFYGKKTGGTLSLEAVNLLLKIIEDRYTSPNLNLYAFWASDGGEMSRNYQEIYDGLLKLSSILQYMSLVEINADKTYSDSHELTEIFTVLAEARSNIGVAYIHNSAAVYPALRSLFKKD